MRVLMGIRTMRIGKRAVTDANAAAGDVPRLRPVGIDDAVSGNPGPGIDAEDACDAVHELIYLLQRCEDFIRDFGVGINLLDVVEILEHLEQLHHAGGFLLAERRSDRGAHRDLGDLCRDAA